jgi:hypothetical protein
MSPYYIAKPGNTKGELVWNQLYDNYFYLQNRQIQTSQIGGQWYNDTSPFSIPWLNLSIDLTVKTTIIT